MDRDEKQEPGQDVLGDGNPAGPETATATEPPPLDPVAELQSKIASLEDALLRAKAETQNVQRRAAAERTEAIRYANAELMRSLIPVLDDFERMVAASAETEGSRLVHSNLKKALSEFGLEAIDALGEQFDPTVHEALLQRPTDEAPPGMVVEQVTRGYRLRDRVLRPARVIVSKAPESGC